MVIARLRSLLRIAHCTASSEVKVVFERRGVYNKLIMLKLKDNQSGFIPMMLTILAIVFAVIIFSFLRLRASQ